VASLLHIKTRTVYALVSKGLLAPHRLPGARRLLFVREEIEGQVKFELWQAALKRAEIVDLRFHDLRHTAATRMAELGVDAFTIAAILGHKSVQMTARYAHATSPGTRQAVEKLANYGQVVASLSQASEARRKAGGVKALGSSD